MKKTLTLLFFLFSLLLAKSQVIISEIHYDNGDPDANERIELFGPAGYNLTGWSIVLYDGTNPLNAVAYSTIPLANGTTIAASCTGPGNIPYGVVVVNVAGIQNGAPDGIALVNNGVVVEFLSYEGVITAVDGPANGLSSADILAYESNLTSSIGSIQRGNGGWLSDPNSNSFGSCNSILLPVYLVSFKGANDADRNVKLIWETTDEVNFSKYKLEKSTDGTSFFTIATLPGLGNASNTYQYTDMNVAQGVNFYRLRMEDIDGRFTNSNTIKINSSNNKIDLSIYPSPASNNINAEFTANKNGAATLQIIDATGKVNLQQKVTLQKGYNNLSINISSLPKGVYTLKVIESDTNFNQRFIKN